MSLCCVTFLFPQVASLQASVTMLQEMFEQQALGIKTTPTGLKTTPTHGSLPNGISRVSMATDSENGVDFVLLPNHLRTAHASKATPTNHQDTPTHPLTPPTKTARPVTPPTPQKGGIISV